MWPRNDRQCPRGCRTAGPVLALSGPRRTSAWRGTHTPSGCVLKSAGTVLFFSVNIYNLPEIVFFVTTLAYETF